MIREDEDFITMSHGAGGEKMEELISETILPFIDSGEGEVPLSDLDDSAVIDDIIFTIDGHTVKPIFFPGGDIGSLSVAGTINDVLSIGGKPIGLATAIVVPEGYSRENLKRILESTGKTAESVKVPIITGDTKVVMKGDLDEPIMTTAGIGRRHPLLDKNFEVAGGRSSRWLSDSNLNEGDKIIVTGYVGDHGVTILSKREGYGFQGDLKSDVAPLVDLMHEALTVGGVGAAKDPTRGGLANTLNEWADKSGIGIEIEENKIPIRNWVSSASEMLGIDPLTIGNEGKMVLAVNPSKAEKILSAIKKTKYGRHAAIIGKVTDDVEGVVLKTEIGGTRILETPVGDPVPRIC
ncbi:MAG: hydrogenase expression/formation protein HypE [Thermoplasmatota archaeon]